MDLRKYYRDIRNQIPAAEKHGVAIAVANQFVQYPEFIRSQHIACYLPVKNEVDTAPIIKAIWQAKKICYLPILVEGASLNFVRYDENDSLSPNQFMIPEPVDMSRKMPPEKLDLVIMPLVAYDLSGHRLGTGGGYYDRTFAFIHASPSRRPVLLGLAYTMQQADRLPVEPWDIALDAVVTEKKLITLPARLDKTE